MIDAPHQNISKWYVFIIHMTNMNVKPIILDFWNNLKIQVIALLIL